MNNEITDKIINIRTREVLDMEVVDTLKDNAMLKIKPELFTEWDFEKNDELDLDIYKITKGSKKKSWWLCKKCSSSYDTMISDKVRGSNCPYCAGKRVNHTNTLLTINPELASEWHPSKNGESAPNNIYYNSREKVWWICRKCTSDYESVVYRRSQGEGCSYCRGFKVNHTNSLSKTHPELAQEWHPTKNNNLTPNDVTYGKSLSVWWLGKCGHEWKTPMLNRGCHGRQCPYCANQKVLVGFNDVWTTNPELASMLDNPEDGYKYTEGSKQSVDWKCPHCNLVSHKPITTVRVRGLACKGCSDGVSYPEKVVMHLLLTADTNFETQKEFTWALNKKYDFYLPEYKMIIEVHGGQHYNMSFDTMGGKSLEEEKKNDNIKRILAKNNGIDIYREIDARYSNIDWIKKSIINSGVSEIIDLSNVLWSEIDVKSRKSLHVEVLNLYNNGKSLSEIEERTKYAQGTIINILRKFKNQGLCEFGGRTYIPIVQLNIDGSLLKEWNSIKDASHSLNIKAHRIYQACRRKNGLSEGYIWMHKDKYDSVKISNDD